MTAAAAGMDALRVRRARGLGDRGQFGPAIAELSKAIFLCPDNAALYAERGHHYAELGDLQSCIRNYRKALSLQPEWPELRERLAAAADALGFAHLSDRFFEAAAHLFGVAVENNDLVFSYHYHQALAMIGLGTFEEAAACLDQAITLNGHVADLFVVRAKVRWALGLEQQGNADIRRAHALEPAHPEIRAFERSLWGKAEARYAEASGALLAGDLSGALRHLNQTLELSPNDVKAMVLRASVKRQLGDHTDALRDLDEASALYRRLCGREEAEEAEWAGEHPEIRKQRSLALNDLALSRMTDRQWSAAVRLLNAVIQLETEGAGADGERVDPRFYVNRGDCHRELGSLQQALADYHRAQDLAPGDWTVATRLSVVHDMFGVQLFNEREYAQAEVEFSTAIACNGKVSRYHMHRGDCLYQQQKFAAAHTDYRRALELDPGCSEARVRMGQFEGARNPSPAVRPLPRTSGGEGSPARSSGVARRGASLVPLSPVLARRREEARARDSAVRSLMAQRPELEATGARLGSASPPKGRTRERQAPWRQQTRAAKPLWPGAAAAKRSR